MTPSQLASYASLLYGSMWASELALNLHRPNRVCLGVSDRLVRYWETGERNIPEWVKGEIERLLRERVRDIENKLRELREDI